MKLDATDLRYITSEEFRVLTAVEMGSKNHEIVPTPLIVQISGLRGGGANKLLGSLAKRNLVGRVQNAKYDGYRLTYGGYDYLSMRALSKRDSMFSVGNQIGVGKESDIYVVADAEGKQMVLKLHRLGRVSFRTIKTKRDYMGNRKSASWMYMSRLAAQKEWAFMKVLYENDFPVPKPIDQSRHCVLMEMIDSFPLRQISSVPSPGKLYSTLMDLIVRFAQAGLIHGDFNEFNILIKRDTSEPIVIDFPQMVSTRHPNAEFYFNRDVDCIRTFFKRRFGYESQLYPKFTSTAKDDEAAEFRLDVMVSRNGFKSKDMKALEEYMAHAEFNDEGDRESQDDYSGEDEEDETVAEEGANALHITNDGARLEVLIGDTEEEDEASDLNQSPISPFKRSRGPSPTLSDLANRTANLNLGSSPPDPSTLPNTSSSLLSEGHQPLSTTDLPLENVDGPSQPALSTLKNLVSSEIQRQSKKERAKHHSKKGGGYTAGRAKGSKAKQDTRVKLGKQDGWD